MDIRAWRVGLTVFAVALAVGGQARAVYLDKGETMKFGLRTYANARVGTESTDRTIVNQDVAGTLTTVLKSETFPYSPSGHLRQNRFFMEAEFDHDMTPLMKQGFGPLVLLKELPFKITKLSYHLTYRGEGEGVYQWGPREFSTSDPFFGQITSLDGEIKPSSTCTLGSCPLIGAQRHELYEKGSNRHRLFQAYSDVSSGDFFMRVGRQILVWGETDAFRLLDNINPIDSSFGGFLISLDERRVPLDMVRMSYRLGDYGDNISEALVEGFAAIDDKTSFYPPTLSGSPWTLPNLGAAPDTTLNVIYRPARTFNNTRGGAKLQFNSNAGLDMTWSIAHYYTYSDIPTVQSCVAPRFPVQRISTLQGGSGQIPGCPLPVQPLPIRYGPGVDPLSTQIAPLAYTIQAPARIQVSGISTTFSIPSDLARQLALSGEPIIRSELAYIKDDAAHSQSSLDPFIYHTGPNPLNTGGVLYRDSINFVLGIDHNQFIRALNEVNSFFFTTQFFYKHVKNAPDDFVLPVPGKNIAPTAQPTLGAVEPVLVKSSADQYLQTLLISTSYMSGQVNPSFTFFYDWSGALVYIPAVTFQRDPFRFSVEYDILDAGTLKGNSGTSLLRDRDNVLFQFEYVL